MKKFKPWLLLGLVFMAGICVGILGTRFVVRRALNPNLIRLRIERDLTRELALTPEQRVKVHQALLDAQGEFKSLGEEVRPRMGAIFEKSQAQIAASLTPEQKEKLDQYISKRKAEMNLFPALRRR